MANQQSLKLLINSKEVANFLFVKIAKNLIKFRPPLMAETHEFISENFFHGMHHKEGKWERFQHNLNKRIERDVIRWQKEIFTEYDETRRKFVKWYRENEEHALTVIGGIDIILTAYKTSNKNNFVKGVGLRLDPTAEFVRRDTYADAKLNCVIRNTVGNETLLLEKLKYQYPFWFIDSGYTNFLETSKKWHRICHNHIHPGDIKKLPPVDRLTNIESFPHQWRSGGEKILIIEPGHFAAGVFEIDIHAWTNEVINILKQYTDKPISVRPKLEKKSRPSLYKELLDDDYYCVINLNSNAAVEAIWAGVPAITLGKHISNSVTRNKLSDINNLHRPHLAEWLCKLSYSQFTYEELLNGTAIDIVKEYYD